MLQLSNWERDARAVCPDSRMRLDGYALSMIVKGAA